MLATLAEAKSSALRNIAGSCQNSPEFLQLVNDATRMLMRRGDWSGTVQPIYVCVRAGCVVFPRYVGSVRRMNWCDTQPLDIHGLWWSFLHYDHYRGLCHTNRYASTCNMISQGRTAVQQDILGPNRFVRVYVDAHNDIGKTVTIFGLDENQQVLKTKNLDGSWSPGIVITAAAPYGSSSVYVSRIDRVLKDETTGPMRLYAYDAVHDVLDDIATYEPSETNPDYARYRLNLGTSCCSTSTACPTAQGVTALVKLQFIPVKLDTDLVLIQNLDALKFMMQAIKFREANDTALAKENELAAIRELNLELADETPNDQIPVSVEPFNGISFENQCF